MMYFIRQTKVILRAVYVINLILNVVSVKIILIYKENARLAINIPFTVLRNDLIY